MPRHFAASTTWHLSLLSVLPCADACTRDGCLSYKKQDQKLPLKALLAPPQDAAVVLSSLLLSSPQLPPFGTEQGSCLEQLCMHKSPSVSVLQRSICRRADRKTSGFHCAWQGRGVQQCHSPPLFSRYAPQNIRKFVEQSGKSKYPGRSFILLAQSVTVMLQTVGETGRSKEWAEVCSENRSATRWQPIRKLTFATLARFLAKGLVDWAVV